MIIVKNLGWFLKLAAIFLSLSLAFYLLHYAVYSDLVFIGKYVIAQMGFLFINVYLVTIILNQLLNNRAKKERLEKLSMVISAFYADCGIELIKLLNSFCVEDTEWKNHLKVEQRWSPEQFAAARTALANEHITMDSQQGSLLELCQLLNNKRDHLLRLLENPAILEHEQFSQILWTVFHISEELYYRGDELEDLPDGDYMHLSSDLQRSFKVLVLQWLDYMYHLKVRYPYMFSLAVRNNPFDEDARVIVS